MMKWIHRAFILTALLVCLLLLPFGAQAAAPQDISISVQWIDGAGMLHMSDPALPVTSSPDEAGRYVAGREEAASAPGCCSSMTESEVCPLSGGSEASDCGGRFSTWMGDPEPQDTERSAAKKAAASRRKRPECFINRIPLQSFGFDLHSEARRAAFSQMRRYRSVKIPSRR